MVSVCWVHVVALSTSRFPFLARPDVSRRRDAVVLQIVRQIVSAHFRVEIRLRSFFQRAETEGSRPNRTAVFACGIATEQYVCVNEALPCNTPALS